MPTLELPEAEDWTPEFLERLPPDFRYEVREGNLVIMPAAMRPWHADVQRRIANLLTSVGRAAYIEQGVVLPDGEVRTCDVGAFRAPPIGSAAYHPASAFELLVEVVSIGSQREDREVKPKLYAAAGVPEFWRVEEGEGGDAVVWQYRLVRLAADQSAIYAEAAITTLTTLESE